jgi:hypothetical protein
MLTPPERFSKLRWLQQAACITALLGAVVLMLLGLLGVGTSKAASGVWLFAFGGLLAFLSILFMTFVPLLLKMESTLTRQLGELRDMHEAVHKHAAMLTSIAENTRISDAAKSLAHREQELDALRTSIRDDLRREKWEAALTLVDEMERRFGYKEEADRFREELDDARNEAIEKKLREAIEIVEGHFQSYDWERAAGEIDRLAHALPDNARVLALRDRMTTLKEQHKHELLLQWEEAVRRTDTDQAINVLKELDRYLSPAEAQSLQVNARHVFKEKLLQLGVAFRFAVMEKRWQDALSSGLELIREFPNARMANEVREAMDTLRQRARATNEAGVA